MEKKMKNSLICGLVFASALSLASVASATPVDLELSLLVDVSGSVSGSEYALQRDGYMNAFLNSNIWNAIAAGSIGSIAVNMVEWSGSNQQKEVVGWTLVDSEASMNALGNTIGGLSRAYSGSTYVQAALTYGADQFVNSFEGARNVIDISGDGSGEFGTAGKDYALANGVDTINGIVIGGSASVLNYYTNNVIGGTGGFVVEVSDFAGFDAAIQAKLQREISGVPEPTTMLLFGTGLAGLAAIGRRRKK